MNRGYVKLWRKTLDSGLFKNHSLFAFWNYCLLKASYKKTKVIVGWQEVELEPGQFVFGRKVASKELAMSEQTIRTCLKNLKNMKNLTIKSTNKFSVITIVNWNTYQGEEFETNQQTNQCLTSSQPATNHIQECKAFKNIKNKNYSADFIKFYQEYPRKVGKEPAWKAWLKRNGDMPPLDILLTAIKQQKDSNQWKKDNGQFIPLPATWINQGRWDDEIKEVIVNDNGPFKSTYI